MEKALRIARSQRCHLGSGGNGNVVVLESLNQLRRAVTVHDFAALYTVAGNPKYFGNVFRGLTPFAAIATIGNHIPLLQREKLRKFAEFFPASLP